MERLRLHCIGGLERPVIGVGQGEDALQAGLHPRLLSELLDELGFSGG